MLANIGRVLRFFPKSLRLTDVVDAGPCEQKGNEDNISTAAEPNNIVKKKNHLNGLRLRAVRMYLDRFCNQSDLTIQVI